MQKTASLRNRKVFQIPDISLDSCQIISAILVSTSLSPVAWDRVRSIFLTNVISKLLLAQVAVQKNALNAICPGNSCLPDRFAINMNTLVNAVVIITANIELITSVCRNDRRIFCAMDKRTDDRYNEERLIRKGEADICETIFGYADTCAALLARDDSSWGFLY